MPGDSVTPVSLTLTLSRREREPFSSVCYPDQDSVSTRYVTRLTGPTFSLRTPVGRASVAPPGNRHPAPFPLRCPVAATPYLAYTRLRYPPGRASAAPPGNRHSAPFPLRCPVAAAPYRAYILPARSCRPGKRSAARQQASSPLPASMPGGGSALPGLHSPCALL
ncbi:hypothetical protein SB01124_02317 [Klebsiella quasipneumoniae subsp. quasipneumoniae]|nr:hypothetical protein SB01124_02317 [Klebsiella quasipneumoniae subsp. quasipneumoniae]